MGSDAKLSHDVGYFMLHMKTIQNRLENDRSLTTIQRFFCSIVLPQWNDYGVNKKYQSLGGEYENMECKDFLAKILDINPEAVESILEQLGKYKNVSAVGSLPECCDKELKNISIQPYSI